MHVRGVDLLTVLQSILSYPAMQRMEWQWYNAMPFTAQQGRFVNRRAAQGLTS